MVVVDLFAGAGGLTEGFVREGFNVVAHVEKEKWACETLKTRICFHFLKARGDLELYYEYLKKSCDYRKLDLERRIIFDKYPELEERVNIEVINRYFGRLNKEPGASTTKSIINLIKKSMTYNSVKEVDVIIGGPPCQAYSLIGRGRMKEDAENDERNYLFKYYREVVNHFRPKLFVFENVPGIFTAKKGAVFENIKTSFEKIGYTVLAGNEKDHYKNILDAISFGVCQRRKRVILLGFKKDYYKDKITYPDFTKNAFSFSDGLNTRNALGDLPKLKAGEGSDCWFSAYSNEENLSEYQKLIRVESPGIIHHKARPNNERDKRIYALAIEKASNGEQLRYSDLPEEYSTHKKKNIFKDRFKVHWWDSIPHTIVAHISKDGHYNIHPDIEQCRSLTVREAARIQSFPDNFKFEGPRTWQFVQVGNAVPPLMAQAIARTIKKKLLDK
ncbi:MAG: DNA cytosine methyltransferase [Dethiobacteria bacterium]|jgi:DNA (cytosine-5)-methyltransferase 1